MVRHLFARKEGRLVGASSSIPSNQRSVKALIWVYFWLLFFEGSLRKWALPMLSDPLLIIRDPVAILIYAQALRGGFFPRHWLVRLTVALGVLTFAWGCLQLYGSVSYKGVVVTAYGVRTYFLHLPLIFVIGRVFDRRDVLKAGKRCLALSIPMALLMAAQYAVDAEHWLNRATTGEGGRQIAAALGKVRPPGTFSFITGPATFYPLVTAFLIHGFMRPGVYSKGLMITAASAGLLVLPLSGSRTLVLACALVALFALVALVRMPRLIPRFAAWSAAAFFVGMALLLTPLGREARESFGTRWQQATESEGEGRGVRAGVGARMGAAFTEVFEVLPEVPIEGFGIGAGTNVGVKLLTGGLGFLLGEAEWTRVVMEAGPVLGFGYIGFRILLAGFLLRMAAARLRAGDALPWLLMSCAFLSLLIGQTGQPTTLGFMVFIAGLSLPAGDIIARVAPVGGNRGRWLENQARAEARRRAGGVAGREASDGR